MMCQEEGCVRVARIHSQSGRYLKRCISCQNNMTSYRITTPIRDAILRDQHGKCKTCKGDIKFYKDGPMDGRAVVDHCHTTGAVRGILCSSCNIALGKVKDDTDTLQNMILYLEEARDA